MLEENIGDANRDILEQALDIVLDSYETEKEEEDSRIEI